MSADKKIGLTLALVAVIVGLVLAVVNGTQSPDCEALYNEYTNTVNMHDRDAVFQEGLSNGCFHYN